MSLKSTINRRRKSDESTKAAAKRLAADKDAGVGHHAAKIWLANKSAKPVKRNISKRTPDPIPTSTSKLRKK